MQELQQTTSSNSYYNLVSALYHALQEAQTSSAYIRDAEQEGQQELARSFASCSSKPISERRRCSGCSIT